jgi:hypothetical protein
LTAFSGGGATSACLEGQVGGPTHRTNACSFLTASSFGPAAFTVSSARPGSPGSRKLPIHARPRTRRVPRLGAPSRSEFELREWPTGWGPVQAIVAQLSSTRRAPLALTYPPIPFLSPPDSGLPIVTLLKAKKARAGVRSHLPPMPATRTPGMRLPTPKSFHPVMPDELSKWSSFFARLSAHHSFSDICRATRGRHKLTPLQPGAHPATPLHNTLRTGGHPCNSCRTPRPRIWRPPSHTAVTALPP